MKKSLGRILYVTTLSSTINAFLEKHIQYLCEKGFLIDVAANFDQPLSKQLADNISRTINIPFSRNPISFRNINAYRLIKRLINEYKYEIIHTHTPVASAVVRFASRKSNTRIFYTAHGFHFHRKSGLLSWLTYYPIEKYLSRYTDTIVTINREDFSLAKSRFKAKNIVFINGVGFDSERFQNLSGMERTEEIKFISVGELNRNKNHGKVIIALSKLNINFKYLIAGEGPYRAKLSKLITKHNLDGRVELLGYKKDILELYKRADVFIFPSLREGLGIAAIEAMSAGLPLLTSNVHGINDYSIENVSGFKFNPKSVKSIQRSIVRIIENQHLWTTFGLRNIEKAREYDIKRVLPQIAQLYETDKVEIKKK